MSILHEANTVGLCIVQLEEELRSLKARMEVLKTSGKEKGFDVFFGTHGVTVSKGFLGEYALLDYEGKITASYLNDVDTDEILFLLTR